MTSLESVQTIAEQPGQEAEQAPVPPGTNPAMTNVPGLPPTALSMQMQSMNDQYETMQSSLINQQAPMTLGSQPAPGAPEPEQYAQSSLKDLAEKMASSYGLNFSRGSLVDEQGTFQQTPDQLAGGGGDLSDTAAQMNYIAQAINDQRVQMQQDKATAALQAGAGLIQKRGRGSLANLQSGFYQAMAANYTNPNLLPEQQDFSYWIQKDQMDEAEADRAIEREAAAASGGGGGVDIVSSPTVGGLPYDLSSNPRPASTDFSPQGTGEVVTSGPHAGQVPVYTYDPINQTTTISWETP